MYKNIIFDLGRVLIDFDPLVHMQHQIPDESVDAVYGAIFKSEEWLMLDRGTLTEKEAIHIFSTRHPEYREHIEQVFENWYDMLQPIEVNIQLMSKLKEAGYKLYYLSNFHDLAFKEVNRRYPFFGHFEGGVVSFEVKLLKPELAIYDRLLHKYGLKKEECLFIDDTKKNIEAAMKVGIDGVWLPDYKRLREELIKKGIVNL